MSGVGRSGRPPKDSLNPLWIKAELIRLGIPQHELAKATGVVQSTIMTWLNNKRTPRRQNAAKLREVLASLGIVWQAAPIDTGQFKTAKPTIRRIPHRKAAG